MANDSMRTVLVALGAGVAIAVAKAGAAAVTGSSALAAEAAHSLADTANFMVGAWTEAAGGRRAAMLLASPNHFGQPMKRGYESFSSGTLA